MVLIVGEFYINSVEVIKIPFQIHGKRVGGKDEKIV